MNVEEKLSAVEQLFTRGSKGFQVAVDIVRKNRDVTMDERALMAEKVGCSDSTVRRVLSKLRRAGLYGGTDEPLTPQDEEEKEEPTEEEPELETEAEEAEEPKEKYVTQEQFNQLVEEIKMLSGITPIPETEVEYVEEQYEAPAPEGVVVLENATMKQYGTWVESQVQLLFDFTKNEFLGGALENFKGNWSDWVNLCLVDYFAVVHNVGVGLNDLDRPGGEFIRLMPSSTPTIPSVGDLRDDEKEE